MQWKSAVRAPAHPRFDLKGATRSPVGVVELLDQLAAVGQSDLNVSYGLGVVEGH